MSLAVRVVSVVQRFFTALIISARAIRWVYAYQNNDTTFTLTEVYSILPGETFLLRITKNCGVDLINLCVVTLLQFAHILSFNELSYVS